MSVTKEGFLKKRGGKNKTNVEKPSSSGKNLQRTNSIVWRNRYFVLTGGSLFYYASHMDEIPKGVVQLKCCTIEEVSEKECKRPFCLSLRNETQDFWVRAETEVLYNEWSKALTASLGKDSQPPPERPKAKGFMFKAQKQVVEKAATSKVGKNILKEYLPDDTWFLLDAMKRMIKNIGGEERAKQVERVLLKIAVKVALLYKGNHVTKEVMMSTCSEPVLKMWQLYIDSVDPKKQDISALSRSIKVAEESFEELLKPHLTPKSISQMKENMDYLAQVAVLHGILTDSRNHEDLEKTSSKLKILKSLFQWYGSN